MKSVFPVISKYETDISQNENIYSSFKRYTV